MPWKLIGQPTWPRKTAITLSATHLSFPHGTNHQLKKAEVGEVCTEIEGPRNWAKINNEGAWLPPPDGKMGNNPVRPPLLETNLVGRGSKSQISGIRFMNLGST